MPAPASRAKKPSAKAPKLAGQHVAFFGEFRSWPSYHGVGPVEVAKQLGARVHDEVEKNLDAVVVGDRRGAGRAEAIRRAKKLGIKTLDEATFRELVRVDLSGKRFAFAGGFDCSPAGFADGMLAQMVKAAGGVATTDVDGRLDFLVMGNRRGPSKIALKNRAEKLVKEEGAAITLLNETAFLELVRVEKPVTGRGVDFAGFVQRLYGLVDQKKLGRALDMLRGDRFQLFSQVDDQRVIGVVGSQSSPDKVYASWLTADGHYGCSELGPPLGNCMGLQGSPCKHLLVLVVGLAHSDVLPRPQALAWMGRVGAKRPSSNPELGAQTFLQYRGAQAGTVDWRPTETIPEDFYAL